MKSIVSAIYFAVIVTTISVINILLYSRKMNRKPSAHNEYGLKPETIAKINRIIDQSLGNQRVKVPNYFGDLNACEGMYKCMDLLQSLKYGEILVSLLESLGVANLKKHGITLMMTITAHISASVKCKCFIISVLGQEVWDKIIEDDQRNTVNNK